MVKGPGKRPSRRVPKKIKLGGKKPSKRKKPSRKIKISQEVFRRILNKEITVKELVEMARAGKMPVDETAAILSRMKPYALDLNDLLDKVLAKKIGVEKIIKHADHLQISPEGAAFLLEHVPGKKIKVDQDLLKKVMAGEVNLSQLVRLGEKGKLRKEVALFLMGQIPFEKTERFVVGRRIRYNEFLGNPFKRRAYEVTRRCIYHKTLNKMIDEYTNRVTENPDDVNADHVLRFLTDPRRKLKLPFDLYFFEMEKTMRKGKFLKREEKRALFREKLPSKITPLATEFGRTYAVVLKEGFEEMRKVKETMRKTVGRARRRKKMLKDIQTNEKMQKGYVEAMAARWRGRVTERKHALRIGQISLDFVLEHGNFPSAKDLMRNPEVKIYMEQAQKAASDDTRIYSPEETEKLKRAIEQARKKKGKR